MSSRREKETRVKAVEVIRAIVALCNDGKDVAFEADLGGNTLTINVADRGHTHVGVPDEGIETLIDNMHGSLVRGCGLSWAKTP